MFLIWAGSYVNRVAILSGMSNFSLKGWVSTHSNKRWSMVRPSWQNGHVGGASLDM